MSAPQKRVNLKILSKILHKEQPALLELENQVQAKVLIFLNRIFLFFVLPAILVFIFSLPSLLFCIIIIP